MEEEEKGKEEGGKEGAEVIWKRQLSNTWQGERVRGKGGGGKGKPRGDRQEEKGRKFVIVLWSFFHYALFIYVSISP